VVEVLRLSLSDSLRMTTRGKLHRATFRWPLQKRSAHIGCAFFIFGWEALPVSGQGVGEVVGVFAVFDDDFHGAFEAG
jgi:hypothetical protein